MDKNKKHNPFKESSFLRYVFFLLFELFIGHRQHFVESKPETLLK